VAHCLHDLDRRVCLSTDVPLRVRRAAVAAFCATVQLGVCGGASVAVGPLGRSADAGLRVARWGAALCCSYSVSRGAFAGERTARAAPRMGSRI
jgi:lipid-binding SYLF domain-containing protein